VRPKIGVEGVPYRLRDVGRVVLHAETLKEVAADPGSERKEPHDDQELDQLRKETLNCDAWTWTRLCSDGEQCAENKAYPPSRKNSPAEGQKRWRFGVENIGVEDREVLKAHASRHLIMHDSVHSSGKNAQGHDLEGFHERSIE